MPTASSTVNRLFNTLTAASRGGYVFVCDLLEDSARCSANTAVDFGLSGEYIDHFTGEFTARLHPEDRAPFREELRAFTAGRITGRDMEYRLLDKTGTYVSCTIKAFSGKDYAGRPAYLACTMTSHTISPHYDPVTALDDQFEFLNYLRKLEEQQISSVTLLIGATRFDDTNDTYGYTFGNRVLRAFAAHLQETTQDTARCFRGEGTQFIVCSQIMNAAEIKRLYAQLKTYAARLLYVDETQVTVEIAGGAVEVDDYSADVHSILLCAKYALDLSEHQMDGSLVVYRNDYLNDNHRTIALVSAIRGSVLNGCDGFYLCYQPILSAGDPDKGEPAGEHLEGAAALLRWDKAPFGSISPAEFIPWLEQDAVFSSLGNWILEQAMTEGRRILAVFPDALINVNLAYMQLEQPDFRQTILALLQKTGFPGRNLCLELTDRCRRLNAEFLKQEVIFLKACGIRVALDGSCLLDLNLVRELPVDIIKVGRSFIQNLRKSDKDRALLTAITAFARESGIRVCAEGVENGPLLNRIRSHHVDAYQGFVASEPVPIDRFMELPLMN